MPTVYLAPLGNGAQFLGSTLVLLNGGLLNTYAAGTTTPTATYTTSAGNVQNANPIVMNSDGRPPAEIWLTGGQAYKFVLTDSLSNTLGTYDNLYGIGDPFAANAQPGPILLTSVAGTNTITAASISGLTLVSGLTVILIPAATNTAAASLNITPSGGSALGAKNIFSGGAALNGNELIINVPSILEYDGTQFNIIGQVGSRGSFTITLTGFTTTVTGTAVWSLTNNVVTLFIPPLTGTSNATSMTATGIPAAITPATNHQGLSVSGEDNGSPLVTTSRCDVGSNSVLTFFKDFSGAAFTNTGTKGLNVGTTITYNLN